MAYVNCLTLRGIKGSALTHGELDNNFLCLDTAISSLNNYVSTNFLTGFTDNYVTGGTYNNGTSSIDFVGTPYFPPFSVNLSQLKFTGNTSGDCITELHVSNLYGCSPITIHDNLQNTTSVASGLFVNVLGKNNTSSASNYSTIAGGENNQIGPGTHSFIGGGQNNTVSYASHSSVVGGKFNYNYGSNSFIGGGINNKSYNNNSVIVGGVNNITGGYGNFIGGGSGNTIGELYANRYGNISGGYGNKIDSGYYGTIGGGSGNRITYPYQYGTSNAYATIGGGWNNTTYAANSFIGGGRGNKLYPGYYTVIVGGSFNYIYSFAGDSSIVGGVNNIIGGYGNFIGGGWNNRITDSFTSFIGGGQINRIHGNYGFIGAGYNNFITSSSFSSIISGRDNKIVGSSGNTTNIHIIGSNITASTSNTTYVNNLRVEGLNNSQPKLSVYGSGTTSPLFLVQGSQGELFSVSDSLIGSLFSVNDISGLPILEVFSDNTILQGSFTAPSLNTTVKVNLSIGQNTIYSIPTSAYTGGFFEYTLSNTGGVRAGTVMSVWSGTSAQYIDTPTSSIGDTSQVTLSVGVSGSNAVFSASATTSNWVIKTIIRSI